MKLVRYGAQGAEKPGLIDKSGQLRDLSAHVKDLNGAAYAPDSLKKLAAIDAASLPAVSGKPRFGATASAQHRRNRRFRRPHDAAKTNVAGRSVNRLTLARRRPVAQAVVGRAEM